MKKMSWALWVCFLLSLSSFTAVFGAPDVGLIENGEVVLIYRDGDTIVSKQCEDHTELESREDCKLKKDTKIERIDVEVFKERLNNLVNLEQLEREKKEVIQKIAKIKSFIENEEFGGEKDANQEELKKLERDLDRIAGLLSRGEGFQEGIEELVEELISNQEMTPIKFSDASRKFEFYVLKAVKSDCVLPGSKGTSCHTSGSTCTIRDENLCADFVEIKAGTFLMGSPRGEDGRLRDEQQHPVTVTKSFLIQKHELTQHQWLVKMGFNPSNFKNYHSCPETHQVVRGVPLCPNHPVENVSWADVQDYIEKVNAEQGLYCGDQRTKDGFEIARKTAGCYRLPTEAEWEYATRGGHVVMDEKGKNNPCGASSTSPYSFESNLCPLSQYAWYSDSSGGQTHPVGSLQPNPAGLYDVHGNVWEWVQDWYGDYPLRSVTDPVHCVSGSGRVIRGGSWGSNARNCRSANRYGWTPEDCNFHVGFRPVRTAI